MSGSKINNNYKIDNDHKVDTDTLKNNYNSFCYYLEQLMIANGSNNLSQIVNAATPAEIKEFVNTNPNSSEIVATAIVTGKVNTNDFTKILTSMESGISEGDKELNEFNNEVIAGRKTPEQMLEFVQVNIKKHEKILTDLDQHLAKSLNYSVKTLNNPNSKLMLEFLARKKDELVSVLNILKSTETVMINLLNPAE
jgi:hypothetical protein